MKIFSFTAVIAIICLIGLTSMVYSPVLDASSTDLSARCLISLILVFQIYLLLFVVYVSFKIFPIFKWVPENENVKE